MTTATEDGTFVLAAPALAESWRKGLTKRLAPARQG